LHQAPPILVRKSSPRVSARAAIGAGAAAVAVVLGAATQAHKTRGMDRAVRRLVRPRRSPRIVKVAKAVSYLASPEVHPWLSAAACVGLSLAKGRVCLAPVIASTSATGVDKASRFIVHQRRPPKATRHKGRERFAFPSGHTSATTAIALTIAMELAENRSVAEQAALYALAGASAVAVGWSRLELDEHWFDDVAGGWAVGIAIAMGASALADVTRA
jgi:undecaprenyl-diphosphatase